MRRVSDKRGRQLCEYYPLIQRLRLLCNNRSELSGELPDWTGDYQVEPHHINGRENERLLDPFNIIMLTRYEHDIEQGQIRGKKHSKEYLLALVKAIRIKQGLRGNNDKETGFRMP